MLLGPMAPFPSGVVGWRPMSHLPLRLLLPLLSASCVPAGPLGLIACLPNFFALLAVLPSSTLRRSLTASGTAVSGQSLGGVVA